MLLQRRLLALFPLAAAMLAACSQPSLPSPKTVHSGDDLVAAIRAAGKSDDSVIHVEPLRQPGVSQLLEKMHVEQAARHYKAAAATLDKALQLSPKAPDLLQERAELAIRLGNYAKAEKLARQSYAFGPKLGSLCARNWQTVLEMRRIADDAAGVQNARKALGGCTKKGPVRM
ncbi:MAG TPA: tetratricopeptide repeat protein [Rhodanobacteraceae bacterium]|nr:tetratricopeptide repeat protein [Rhodanobacteraceae bacterium]